MLSGPWAAGQLAEVARSRQRPAKQRPLAFTVIDDVPVFSMKRVRGRASQKFAVLALFEVFLDPVGRRKVEQLRLLRAYPRHDAAAYRLLLNELGYVPDYVLSDGATGIFRAIRSVAAGDRHRFQPMLSAYHVRNQLRRLFSSLKPQGCLPSRRPGLRPGDLGVLRERRGVAGLVAPLRGACPRSRLLSVGVEYPLGVGLQAGVRPADAGTRRVGDAATHHRRAGGGVVQDRHAEHRQSFPRFRQPGAHQPAAGPDGVARQRAAGQRRRGGRGSAPRAEAHDGYAAPTRTVVDQGMHRSLTNPAALEELAKAACVL